MSARVVLAVLMALCAAALWVAAVRTGPVDAGSSPTVLPGPVAIGTAALPGTSSTPTAAVALTGTTGPSSRAVLGVDGTWTTSRGSPDGPGAVPSAVPRHLPLDDPAAPTAVDRSNVPARTGWTAVLVDLEAERSAAFAAGDPALLQQVYAPGSPPLGRDSAALIDLREQGLVARGLRLEIEEVTLLAASPTAATIRVADRLPSYTLVDEAGVAVQTATGRDVATWVLTLEMGVDGWRISEIDRG